MELIEKGNEIMSYTRKMMALVLCASLLIISGCGKKKKEEAKVETPVVTVSNPVSMDLEDYYQATGELQAQHSVDVVSEVSGKILELKADEGTVVRKGQVVAVIDPSVIKTQLAQSEANMLQAKAAWDKTKTGSRPQELAKAEQEVYEAKSNYDLAKADYQRTLNMFNQGVASKQEKEYYENQMKVKEAVLARNEQALSMVKEGERAEDREAVKAVYEQAKANVDYQRLQLSKTRIVSPIDGVVTLRYQQAGNMVVGGAGSPIVRIEKINPIKAVLKAPQEDQAKFQIGMPVKLKMDSGNTFTGKVSLVAPAIEADSRAVKIEAILPNAKNALRPGSFVEGNILLQVKKNAMTLKRDWLQKSGATNTYSVFVFENGKAVKKEVKTGILSNGDVEILGGISPESQVIISGFERFADGDTVTTESSPKTVSDATTVK